MNKFVQHVAGEMAEGLQHCILCGSVLIDYRDSYFIDGGMVRGWPEGPVCVNGNFSMAGTPAEEEVVPCISK